MIAFATLSGPLPPATADLLQDVLPHVEGAILRRPKPEGSEP